MQSLVLWNPMVGLLSWTCGLQATWTQFWKQIKILRMQRAKLKMESLPLNSLGLEIQEIQARYLHLYILFYYFTILLFCYFTILLFYYFTISLFHYFTISLFHYFTISLFYYFIIYLLFQDVAFTDDKGLYMIFPVKGGRFNGVNKKIRKHEETPSVSSERIFIKSCRTADGKFTETHLV